MDSSDCCADPSTMSSRSPEGSEVGCRPHRSISRTRNLTAVPAVGGASKAWPGSRYFHALSVMGEREALVTFEYRQVPDCRQSSHQHPQAGHATTGCIDQKLGFRSSLACYGDNWTLLFQFL